MVVVPADSRATCRVETTCSGWPLGLLVFVAVLTKGGLLLVQVDTTRLLHRFLSIDVEHLIQLTHVQVLQVLASALDHVALLASLLLRLLGLGLLH